MLIQEKLYNIINTQNSLPAIDIFCWLITFANSLHPDHARQNVQPDLDPTVDPAVNSLMVILKEFFEK